MCITRPSQYLWRSNSGSILIVTFWALAFLSFFAVTIGVVARQKMTLVQRLDSRLGLRLIAEAGILRGRSVLSKPDSLKEVDFLNENWAQGLGLRDVSLGGGILNVSIVDENRKVNVNTADLDVLKVLFVNVLECSDLEAEALASAIIDWRDADNFSLVTGAENDVYENLPRPYACKNSDFEFLDELLLVRGMSATIYQKVKDYVTVWGSGLVNVNTAGEVVLSALGLSQSLVKKIVDFRAGEDGVTGTQDDRLFSNLANVSSSLSQVFDLTTQESAQLGNLASGAKADVTSSDFLVESQAGYEGRKGQAVVTCVFGRQLLEDGLGYRCVKKYWHISYGS